MRLARLLFSKAATLKGPPSKYPKPEEVSDGLNKLTGLKWKELKHHYAIIPIYGLTFLAAGLAAAYVFRLATKHPEVSWTKNNPEPWNDYTNKQYKFTNYWGRDYRTSSQAPKLTTKTD